MCRNIKMLYNFEPPVTPDEVRAASLQFVRKISGFNKPSKANEVAFEAAIDGIASVSAQLLASLETNAPPKNREEEAAKARLAARIDSEWCQNQGFNRDLSSQDDACRPYPARYRHDVSAAT
jgi:hypothetical protein